MIGESLEEVVWSIAGLRLKGLSKIQHKSWCQMLENWHPEQVLTAARKVAKTWTGDGDWQIATLIQALPAAGSQDGDDEPFTGFAWDVHGGSHGNWSKFDALPFETRREIARQVLEFGFSAAQVDLAERMSPGVFAECGSVIEAARERRHAQYFERLKEELGRGRKGRAA